MKDVQIEHLRAGVETRGKAAMAMDLCRLAGRIL